VGREGKKKNSLKKCGSGALRGREKAVLIGRVEPREKRKVEETKFFGWGKKVGKGGDEKKTAKVVQKGI